MIDFLQLETGNMKFLEQVADKSQKLLGKASMRGVYLDHIVSDKINFSIYRWCTVLLLVGGGALYKNQGFIMNQSSNYNAFKIFPEWIKFHEHSISDQPIPFITCMPQWLYCIIVVDIIHVWKVKHSEYWQV